MSLSNQKTKKSESGFTLPMVMIFVLAFVAIPLLFWVSKFSPFSKSDVKGVSTSSQKDGFYLNVVSKNGSWNLYEYLCEDLDKCKASLDAGKKWEVVSGGTTEGSSIRIYGSETFKSYKYLKLFAKPSEGSAGKQFTATGIESVENAINAEINNVGVVFVPISAFDDAAHHLIIFEGK